MKNKDIENDLNTDFSSNIALIGEAFYFIHSLNTLKLEAIKCI